MKYISTSSRLWKLAQFYTFHLWLWSFLDAWIISGSREYLAGEGRLWSHIGYQIGHFTQTNYGNINDKRNCVFPIFGSIRSGAFWDKRMTKGWESSLHRSNFSHPFSFSLRESQPNSHYPQSRLKKDRKTEDVRYQTEAALLLRGNQATHMPNSVSPWHELSRVRECALFSSRTYYCEGFPNRGEKSFAHCISSCSTFVFC